MPAHAKLQALPHKFKSSEESHCIRSTAHQSNVRHASTIQQIQLPSKFVLVLNAVFQSAHSLGEYIVKPARGPQAWDDVLLLPPRRLKA